jgi:hypothetical protein
MQSTGVVSTLPMGQVPFVTHTPLDQVQSRLSSTAAWIVNTPSKLAGQSLFGMWLSAVALLAAVVSFASYILYWLGKPAVSNWMLAPKLGALVPKFLRMKPVPTPPGFRGNLSDPTGVNSGIDTAVMDHTGANGGSGTKAAACAYNPADIVDPEALARSGKSSGFKGRAQQLTEESLIAVTNYS